MAFIITRLWITIFEILHVPENVHVYLGRQGFQTSEICILIYLTPNPLSILWCILCYNVTILSIVTMVSILFCSYSGIFLAYFQRASLFIIGQTRLRQAGIACQAKDGVKTTRVLDCVQRSGALRLHLFYLVWRSSFEIGSLSFYR